MKRVLSIVTLLLAGVGLGVPERAAIGQNGLVRPASSGSGPAITGSGPAITLPNKETSVRFAVIGDTGSGSSSQTQLGQVLQQARSTFPFEFALMLGDNLYGGEDANDYASKFEIPYKSLLDGGVKFYAALGNHDRSTQRLYKHFNMGGKEYYTFKRGNVRFFALNSNYMDKPQLAWLDAELAKSGSDWKICFFHHPLYSSGAAHGPDVELRRVLEPMLVKHGVNVVFAGHEHFYERIKPQKGIYHFISGAGGKLREGGVKKTNQTEKSFDQDLNFMLLEIEGDQMHVQVISRAGKTIDSTVLTRNGNAVAKP